MTKETIIEQLEMKIHEALELLQRSKETEKRERLYTVKEAAKIMNLCEQQVKRRIAKGDLKKIEQPGAKRHTRILIPESELAMYLGGAAK